MTLGELITALVDADIEDPSLHDQPVAVETGEDGLLWLVVGAKWLGTVD